MSIVHAPQAEKATTSILVVDHQTLVREGLRAILTTRPEFHIVGEAADSSAAASLAGEKRPDVVLLDVDTPGKSIAETIRMIRKASPLSEIITLADCDESETVRELLDLGVRGYLLKNSSQWALIAAIYNVQHGNESAVLLVSRSSINQASPATKSLSPIEISILRLAAKAMTNGQIAVRLELSEAVVKKHLRNVFAKLGAVSRLDAVNKAVAARLVPSLP
ncbi:DNA-binding response regulator [Amycolatopsis balhimycina DSM 5908]|uniref:DNA-binding response regulator n=1 Tax=Amycolatopsis balhimycina DSM 5908 TaxID=1081091 RepID=A0A428WWH5_AMYBA|nr:response regulator transcription factor [Amycolatopsis balhimycina]RSM47367.1 DNA-binding response regulator [Amycolatopsis balhimycina DSM 5908]